MSFILKKSAFFVTWLAVSFIFSGCAALKIGSEDVLPIIAADASASSDDSFVFEFVVEDKTQKDDGFLGAGIIKVVRNYQEIQTIKHDFRMPAAEILKKSWLSLQDFNGDGNDDFVVISKSSQSDQSFGLASLFLYDEELDKFVRSEEVSGIGEIARTEDGCLVVTQGPAIQQTIKQHFCLQANTGKWVRQRSAHALRWAPNSSAESLPSSGTACAGSTPDLSQCRKLRAAADTALTTAVSLFKKNQQNELQKQYGKAYAQRFGSHLDASHRVWMQYRDTHCMAQIRELGLQGVLLNAAHEACRLDLAHLQLQQYRLPSPELSE